MQQTEEPDPMADGTSGSRNKESEGGFSDEYVSPESNGIGTEVLGIIDSVTNYLWSSSNSETGDQSTLNTTKSEAQQNASTEPNRSFYDDESSLNVENASDESDNEPKPKPIAMSHGELESQTLSSQNEANDISSTSDDDSNEMHVAEVHDSVIEDSITAADSETDSAKDASHVQDVSTSKPHGADSATSGSSNNLPPPPKDILTPTQLTTDAHSAVDVCPDRMHSI